MFVRYKLVLSSEKTFTQSDNLAENSSVMNHISWSFLTREFVFKKIAQDSQNSLTLSLFLKPKCKIVTRTTRLRVRYKYVEYRFFPDT